MTEREAMARAIELARGGWGRVAPNPMVGAVLLSGGRVVGEGFHAEFGGPHAEVRALAACGDARGATCVVNLEPCAHHGKTPPCTEALIAAGIAQVVFAIHDPSPAGGGGADRLRQAGVAVSHGVGATEAAALNAAFLWARVRPERPFVALKLATSLDGYVADVGGDSRWVSGPEAREFVHWLRAGVDAIGVGRRTAVRDDPLLTARGAVVPRLPPRRVVFARSGDLPARLQVVQTAREVPTVVIVDPGAHARASSALGVAGVSVLPAGGLEEALQALRSAGVESLLVEGGGMLAAALLDADLVDRLYWIQAPIWLGGGTPGFGLRRIRPLTEAAPWSVIERRALGRDTLLVVDRALCSPES